MPLIMLAAMLVMMYFLMIRPENKRKKESDAMRASLQVGDLLLYLHRQRFVRITRMDEQTMALVEERDFTERW